MDESVQAFQHLKKNRYIRSLINASKCHVNLYRYVIGRLDEDGSLSGEKQHYE
jgi:hypothetical protein